MLHSQVMRVAKVISGARLNRRYPMLALILQVFPIVCAGELPCSQVHDWARITTVRSVGELEQKNDAGSVGYVRNLLLAYREFQLTHDQKRAASFLQLIPTNESEQLAFLTLGDSLCAGELKTDMEQLAAVRDGLPHQLAKAVVLAPAFLNRYIRYSLVACRDPHSDFAVRMQEVCAGHRKRFLVSVRQLSLEEQRQLRAHVFEVETCRALAVPESNQ